MLLEKEGLISNLEREVKYVLAPSVVIGKRKKPEFRYFADFVYTETKSGVKIVEDCKGVRTPVYVIKRHLMKSVHGIDILET